MNFWVSSLIFAALFASSVAASPSQSTVVCPARSDACMNDVNLAKCQELQRSGCKQINILESCPLQFSCANPAAPPPTRPSSPSVVVAKPFVRAPARPAAAAPTRQSPAAVPKQKIPVAAPKQTTLDCTVAAPQPKSEVDKKCASFNHKQEHCYSQKVYFQCRRLARRGCPIAVFKSCPPKLECVNLFC
jgi:hypothetical protein